MTEKVKITHPLTRLGIVGLGTLAAFILWFWDEALFVAPIAAVTAWVGPLYGWIIMASVYFALFFSLSLYTLHRFKQDKPHTLGKWIERQLNNSKKSRFYTLIKSGTNGAIVASCFFLGGLITSHLVYRLRLWPRADIRHTALRCNFWFAILWVGFYSGVFGIIFTLIRKLF